MKKVLALMLALCMTVALCACGAAPAAPAASPAADSAADPAAEVPKDVITLRFADTNTPGDPDYTACTYFADLVKERTNGQVVVEIYHSSQLGSDKAITEACMAGTVDIAKCSAGNFTQFSDVLMFCDLPGLFRSMQHMRNVWQDQDFRQKITDKMLEDTGMYPLMFPLDAGEPRGIGITTKEIRTPDDMKGVKIRSTGSAVELALFNSWGASAISMEFTEVYSGLQQNLIDATYNQAHILKINSMNEIIKYFTPTAQSWVTAVKVIGPKAIEKLGGLDSELFKIVRDAALEAELYMDELWADANVIAYNDMADHGIVVVELTDEEKALWAEKSASIWDQFVGKTIPAEIVEFVQSVEG